MSDATHKNCSCVILISCQYQLNDVLVQLFMENNYLPWSVSNNYSKMTNIYVNKTRNWL